MKSTYIYPGIVALLSLNSTMSYAREWYLEPTSNLRTEFDDNIRLQTRDQQNAYGFVASSSAKGGMRTELFNVALQAGVDIYQYWGLKGLDRENVNVGLQTDYTLNQRNRFGLDFSYIKDTSLTSEFNGGIGLVIGQVGRDVINIAPSWTYSLSDAESVKLTYAHYDASYDKSQFQYLKSYTTDSGDLTYSHQLTQTIQYFASLGAMRYQLSDNSVNIDNYSFNLGGDYKYSEKLSFNVMIGARDTISDIAAHTSIGQDRFGKLQIINVDATSSNKVGSLFSLGMKQIFETGNLALSYTRNISPTAGGVLQQSDSIVANIEHKLTEQVKLQLSGSANFYTSTSAGNTNYNRDYFSIEPKVSWLIDRQLSLVGGYRYRTQQYDSSNVAASSNALFCYINYQWDKMSNNEY